MDIKNTDNKCDLKCSYSFNYGEVSIQSILMDSQLVIKCSKPSVAPVKFNDSDYFPISASIYYPSYTKYNGVSADAEIEIVHNSDFQKKLSVRVPISISSITKPAILEEVINQTANLLPKTGFTNLNIPSFSFESFVPKGPFYFSETDSSYNIYYGLDGSLFLTDELITKLKQIVILPAINKNSEVLGDLFYNSDGSNLSTSGSSGDNFNFMECEQYYEEDVPVNITDNSPSLLTKLLENKKYVMAIYVIFLFIVCGLIFYYVLRPAATMNSDN